MIPTRQDLILQEYNSFSEKLTWTENGTAVDLTSGTAIMQCRLKYGGAQVFALSSQSLTASGSSLILGGTAGTIDVNITDSDAVGIPLSQYDILVTLANGNQETPFYGDFYIQPGISVP